MLSPLSDPRPTPPALPPSSSSAPLPPHPPPFTAVSAAVAAAAAEAMANSTPTSPLPHSHPQDLFLGADSLKTQPPVPKDAPPVGPPGVVGPPAPRSPQPRQNQVGTVLLHGEYIVSLMIDARERLCLAQISNTLLKDFSYNEIHNRRVALGITCVQCTPVQLEILRRAGAMPISSRRCGMITKREAERLVKSFLEDTEPPKLPESFAFNVIHACGWGCSGQFLPARYNSSRAKCIKCDHCAMFFSPNKFIFHFHRLPDAKYHHPDAANFNSWRRHLRLNYDNPSEELVHVWEDVKAMFNGGSRKRLVTSGPGSGHGGGSGSKSSSGGSGRSGGGSEHGKRPRMQGVVEAGSTAMMGKMAAGLPYPYPVMPLSAANNACSNMAAAAAAGAYMSRAPHPAFPFPAPADPSVFPTAAIDATKAAQNNMADFWKTKTAAAAPYVHPFNYFWAKNLALYNDNTAPYRNVLDFSRQAAGKPLPVDPVGGKTSHPATHHPHPHHPRLSPPAPSPPSTTPTPRDPPVPHPDVDKYFSAFKPVARENNNKMAAAPFDDPLPLPAEDRASCWLSPDARSSDNSDMSAMGDDGDSVTGQDADDADVINVTDVEHAESRDAPDDVTGDQQSAGNGVSVGHEVHSPPLTSRRADDVTENDAGSCSPLRLTKSDKTNTEEVGEAEVEPVVHRPWADSDRIYNMSREELQSELRRMMEERRRAEVDYLGLSATYEDKVKRHGDLREGMDRPLHLVKDAVQCPEVEEERQAQQLMHDKLKEAREALQQFSHKMMALRGCIDCT